MSNQKTVETLSLSADQLQAEQALTQGLKSHSDSVPFEKLRADFGRNIRIQRGTSVFGTTFNADTYDTESLMIQIIELGFIRDPLLVSRKKDEKGEIVNEVLRGFRRYDAARRIIQAGTNLNVIESFKRIPCIVYENLTREQEDSLINDQTSKQFQSCEVLREVFRRFGNGDSWQRIGLHMAPQIARATGATGKDNEIAKAKSVAEKMAIVQKWLNNTLNQFWQGIYIHGGPIVRKWLFLTYADKDGLLSETDEKAPFPITSTVWLGNKGINLQKAIQADVEAGTWDREKGTGPNFEARVEELKLAHANRGSSTRKPGERVAKSAIDIQKMIVADGRSLPIKQALESCLVDSPNYQLEQWDIKLNSLFGKVESFNNNRGILPAPIVEILSLAFDTSASVDDFDAKLASLASMKTEATQTPSKPAKRQTVNKVV